MGENVFLVKFRLLCFPFIYGFFQNICFSFVILLFLFTLRPYCTIHWITYCISMEKPEQCNVVIALIVTELASGCVCVCGRVGGEVLAPTPSQFRDNLIKDYSALFSRYLHDYIYELYLCFVWYLKILFVSGRTLLEKPSGGDRLCPQQRSRPAPCRPLSHHPAAPS